MFGYKNVKIYRNEVIDYRKDWNVKTGGEEEVYVYINF